MMPPCSRPVDDGRQLWCSESRGSAAYSYQGKLLHRVAGPRLAAHRDDGKGVDRTLPVFTEEEGAPVRVDLDTGEVVGPYSVPGSRSIEGTTTLPIAYTVGDLTLLDSGGGATLVDPTGGKIIWINPGLAFDVLPFLIKGELLLGSFELVDIVDPRTGELRASVRTPSGSAVALATGSPEWSLGCFVCSRSGESDQGCVWGSATPRLHSR